MPGEDPLSTQYQCTSRVLKAGRMHATLPQRGRSLQTKSQWSLNVPVLLSFLGTSLKCYILLLESASVGVSKESPGFERYPHPFHTFAIRAGSQAVYPVTLQNSLRIKPSGCSSCGSSTAEERVCHLLSYLMLLCTVDGTSHRACVFSVMTVID